MSTENKEALSVVKGINKATSFTPREYLSEILPALMDLMMTQVPGKVAYAASKNWKFLRDAGDRIREDNMEKLREYCELKDDGTIFTSVKDGEREPTPDFKSVSAKQDYQEWYKTWSQTQQYETDVYVVPVSLLYEIQNIKPSIVATLKFIFHDA